MPLPGEFSMSLDSDVIVDRRRIRRKLTFWRVVAALLAIAAVIIIGSIATPGGRGAFTARGSIARVNIEGLIRSNQDRVEALERLADSKAAAVIVHINSPGGTTAGSEQLYDALVQLKAKKPLVVVVEGLAASGGYITAIAADHPAARQDERLAKPARSRRHTSAIAVSNSVRSAPLQCRISKSGPSASTAMIAATTMSTGITSTVPSGTPGNSFSMPRA